MRINGKEMNHRLGQRDLRAPIRRDDDLGIDQPLKESTAEQCCFLFAIVECQTRRVLCRMIVMAQ